jgi:excisionase family DNA binding protein
VTFDDDNDRADRARKGSPFLTTAQAAFYVGLTRQTLERMRRSARGPCFRKHGRYVRYHIADLDAWSIAQGHGLWAEEGAPNGGGQYGKA